MVSQTVLSLMVLMCIAVVYGKSYCEHNGIRYAPGESFISGCNRCNCGEMGAAACTQKGCLSSETKCNIDGKQYGRGEKYMAAPPNECNTCECGADGKGMCTKKACIDAVPRT